MNSIPEQEYKERLIKIMEAITPKGKATGPEAAELFNLYNDRLTPYESTGNIFCSGCVHRVFTKMKEYYELNK